MLDSKWVKAVLFDLDGVLIDSASAWLSAFNDTLREFGRDPLSMEEFRNVYWGHGLDVNLKKSGLRPESLDYCKERFVEHMDEIEVISGVERILRWWEGKTGLVTSTPKRLTKEVLKRFDLRRFFEVIVDGDTVENLKPAPDPILKACEDLDVQPREAVFVGDTESDVKAGRAAGCKIVGFGVSAGYTIEDLLELKEYLT